MYGRPKARNRLVIIFIITCCLTSLYVLILKINRMIHLDQLERNSDHLAVFSAAVYYNSTFSTKFGVPEVHFIVTSRLNQVAVNMNCQSNNGSSFAISELEIKPLANSLLLGSCSVVDDPVFVSLVLDDFVVQIDEPDVPLPPKIAEQSYGYRPDSEGSVVCMAHLLLFEDGATLLALLDHFERTASQIFIYAASLSDELYHSIQKRSEKVMIVPWKLPVNGKVGEHNQLNLDPSAVYAATEASLTDCFLRAAPTNKKIELVDLAAIRFEAAPLDEELDLNPAVVGMINADWSLEQLLTYRVSQNSHSELVLNQKCYTRNRNSSSSQLLRECYQTQTPPPKKLSVKKTEEFDNKSMYADALSRCASYKAPIDEKRQLMKLEFELKQPQTEPCELQLYRDGFRCRVAVEYNKKMYRERLKISVTNKRALLHFRDGCNL
ncbi:unnamed protein product [Caenorhabditis auriculariae]|uniref:Glycosyltransferase family 92 protein n=1 Tax=Caenorhabditis auriculariae TaxID=2777116 RepID=A0A8S1HE66_9PELO|nr:unnamed protein product [Caenorhabditis auriculariae]